MSSSNGWTKRVNQWVNDRFPISFILKEGLREPIPGGARFTYVLGSATLFLFIIQLVTGVWQMFYYADTTDHAYTSVTYLRLHVPFGWLMHGLHYWGAQAFIVVMGLHVIRVFVWAAYKKPRELTWLFGVALLVVSAGLVFTGALLPWDTLGYWAAEVGTGIAGTVPVIGNFTERLLRGGGSMTQLTLSRFYVLHVVILPFILMALITGHIIAFRKQGSVGPWKKEKRKGVGPFWPDQIFKDLLVMAGLLVILIGLSVFVRAPITGRADPLNTSYSPKPEWNFLFLYQALKIFKGAWEPLGTVGLPTIILLLFVSLPFLDRRPERNPLKRPVVMSLGFMFVAGVIYLTVMGDISNVTANAEQAAPATKSTATKSTAASTAQATTAKSAAKPLGGKVIPASEKAQIKLGHQLFMSQGCIGCHAVNGAGGHVGPDLAFESQKGRTKAWLMAQLINPRAHSASSIMPSFKHLPKPKREALVAYLLSLKPKGGKAAGKPAKAKTKKKAAAASSSVPLHGEQGPPGPASKMIGDAVNGHVLFNQYCFYCHGKNAAQGVANPGSASGHVPTLSKLRGSKVFSTNPLTFASNIDQFIQHGSRPLGKDPTIDMPVFGDNHALTQAEIANIEAYLLQLNGVDRAKIIDPGIPPVEFFIIAVVVLAGIVLLVTIILAMIRPKPRSDDRPSA